VKKLTEDDDIKQMFRRFESREEIDYENKKQIKSNEDVIRKIGYWQNRPVSPKLKAWINDYLRTEHPNVPIKRAKGISEKKGASREQLKRRYVAVTYHTKKGIVRYMRPRDSKTGRFTKRG
jgi:hypothetical protein